MKIRDIRLCYLLPALILFQSCASSSAKTADRVSSNQLSAYERKEMEIGRQIHAQVLSSFYLYTEPHLVEYVNRLGERMAQYAERRNLNYQFTVILDEKIFATSAPGGYVYVTTGLLDFLDNEAQLAAVLAHEIGQLQYRDPRFSNSRKAIEKLTVGGSIVGGFFGDIGMLAVLGLQAMDALTDEKSKEERVDAADMRAVQYLAAAGYDPECWTDVLYKMVRSQKDNLVRMFDYYNARPISEKRLQKLRKDLRKLNLRGKTLETRSSEYQQETKGVRQIYAVSPVV